MGTTPLYDWFEEREIEVNSYRHLGVKRLMQRFVPMAYAPDGLVEGFYDEGKFIMGLQFHPERMRNSSSDKFDYLGWASAYWEFVKAVISCQKRLNGNAGEVLRPLKLDAEMEKKRKVIVKCFSLMKNLYNAGKNSSNPSKDSELKTGTEFLESNTALSLQQEKRLKQIGATLRNSRSYIERLRLNEDREKMARTVLGKMTLEQLSNLVSFYRMMERIGSEVVEWKLQEIVNDTSSEDQGWRCLLATSVGTHVHCFFSPNYSLVCTNTFDFIP